MGVLDYETWTDSDVAFFTCKNSRYSATSWLPKRNPFTTTVHDGVLSGGSNFCVCGQNLMDETSSAVLSHGNIVFQHFTK